MARKKKGIAGAADYIIPIAVVLGGTYVIYRIGQSIGLWGQGTGSGLAPGSSPSLIQNLTGPGAVLAPATLNQLTDNVTAQTWLNNYAQTRGQDCFTSALYKANPGNATLGPGDAQTLYNLIHSQAGTWFSDGDFTGVLAAFQNVVENQTDVSFVASLFEQNDNKDLFTYITQAGTFANGTNPSHDNMQLVQQFVQWCLGLSVSGQQA
jgi:hypothetical protein